MQRKGEDFVQNASYAAHKKPYHTAQNTGLQKLVRKNAPSGPRERLQSLPLQTKPLSTALTPHHERVSPCALWLGASPSTLWALRKAIALNVASRCKQY